MTLYAPAFRRGGPFIMSSTSGPDDAKLRAAVNRFLTAIGSPAVLPGEDLVTALQNRVDQLHAGGRPSAPAPTAMASRPRKGTPVRTLADIQRADRVRYQREVAERAASLAKRRGITIEAAMKFITPR